MPKVQRGAPAGRPVACSTRVLPGSRALQETSAEPEPQSAPETVGLRPLDPPLPDALLDLIADALRKFPEVEWACELSDGSPLPVVGVRIDPSFQTRAGEVRAAVLAVASKRKTELAVLLLSDAQVMKEARANGSAFFPWRKRAAKRSA